mmetsp:Transcript_19633/g.75350  ORF Transcript_19633/g.75350 Transcript_19633/m.75350 type:complete len:220 (+) Transcript_19633:841-1500(+)
MGLRRHPGQGRRVQGSRGDPAAAHDGRQVPAVSLPAHPDPPSSQHSPRHRQPCDRHGLRHHDGTLRHGPCQPALRRDVGLLHAAGIVAGSGGRRRLHLPLRRGQAPVRGADGLRQPGPARGERGQAERRDEHSFRDGLHLHRHVPRVQGPHQGGAEDQRRAASRGDPRRGGGHSRRVGSSNVCQGTPCMRRGLVAAAASLACVRVQQRARHRADCAAAL